MLPQRGEVLEFPKVRVLWAGTHGWNGAWTVDTHGRYHGTAEDGTRDVPRILPLPPLPTSGGKKTVGAAGFIEHRVEVVLYAPFTGPQTMPEISAEAIRAFTVIVATTAAPITPGQRGVPARLHYGRKCAMDLVLRDLPPGDDADPLKGAKELSWQP